jgi:phosphoglycerol transferase MdoB-like AlkP superfamily enzyme
MLNRLLQNLLPKHAQNFWRMILLSTGILFLLRILFYFVHRVAFNDVAISDWFTGLWFDLITVCIVFLPYAIIHFLPLPHRNNKVYRIWTSLYFLIANLLLIGLNLIDVEYFKYTGKRSTSDLISMTTTGNDMSQLIGTFLAQFWWLVLVLVLFIFGLLWLRKKWSSSEKSMTKRDIIPHTFVLIISLALVILIGRGGIGLRPVGIIEAARYTKPSNTALVLNTAFTMLKSYGAETLEEKNFFTEAEANKLFNPIKNSKPANLLADKTNVVIIILESFGNEWLNFNNPSLSKTYTPFLDSLASESMWFENGFANGKKSIEAVPAIVSSIPSLMNNPYISSMYGNNKIKSLANILKEEGYSSGFYHAATNGSMRFDGFAAQAGYENYFGRFEYNNDDHFDKTWGILDEYFNPWAAKQMSQLKAPFFSTLFTISSHHPYFIPEDRKNDVIHGPEPICASISYGDYSLKQFFIEARKQKWYKNTLFVICADHTPSTSSEIYSQRDQMYRIPILFYEPNGKLPKGKRSEIFQHLDILPTVLDLLNIERKYYAFGNSIFQNVEREAITYLEGIYYYFNSPFMITFSGSNSMNMLDLAKREEMSPKEKKQMTPQFLNKEKRLKAMIQRYNHDLIKNQTSVK